MGVKGFQTCETWLMLCIFIGLSIIAFIPTLDLGFWADDTGWMFGFPSYQSRIIQSLIQQGLADITLRPGFFRLLNSIIHGLNACLLALLANLIAPKLIQQADARDKRLSLQVDRGNPRDCLHPYG
ncbi:hypothetical protein JW905_01985 [bacterium]|nr:hypothetical protein [candidate division CSSED10-310 bacterium]